jgi:hypothetical protein
MGDILIPGIRVPPTTPCAVHVRSGLIEGDAIQGNRPGTPERSVELQDRNRSRATEGENRAACQGGRAVIENIPPGAERIGAGRGIIVIPVVAVAIPAPGTSACGGASVSGGWIIDIRDQEHFATEGGGREFRRRIAEGLCRVRLGQQIRGNKEDRGRFGGGVAVRRRRRLL